MAQLTMYLADGDVSRVVAAFEQRFGPKEISETEGDFIRRHMESKINDFVRVATVDVARDNAGTNYVPLDWTEP